MLVETPTYLRSAGWSPYMKVFAQTRTRTHALRSQKSQVGNSYTQTMGAPTFVEHKKQYQRL